LKIYLFRKPLRANINRENKSQAWGKILILAF